MLTGLLPLIGSALAILTAVMSYGLSRKAHVLSTRTAEQTSRRGRSEETMRLLRWAVELAVDNDERRRRAGTAALRALKNAVLVIRSDRAFVHAVAEAVMAAADDDGEYPEETHFYHHADPNGDDDG